MSALAARVGGRSAAIGLVMLTVVGLAVVGNFTGLVRGLLSDRGTREVTAIFANSQQLKAGSFVRIRGIDVGKVDRLESVDGGRATKVTMRVEDDAADLHADAQARLRWRTVLGSAFYVDLDPGHATDGPLSGPIPRAQTSAQIELEDVTSVFSGRARTGLQTIPGELSQALRDHATPGRLLNDVADAAPDIAAGVGALRGQRRDADLQQLVGSTSRLVDVLGRSQGRLRQVVAGAAATLETTGSRAAAIDATLARTPAVLRETDATVARLDATLENADPLLAALKRPAGDVAPTLAKLNPTVRDADALLTDAVPLLRDLRPTARSLARTAAKGLPLLKGLDPSIERVDETVIPSLAAKGKDSGLSTTVAAGGFAAAWGPGFAGQRDTNGGLLRFALTAGSAPFYLPCQTYINNPDKAQQVQCEGLQLTLDRFFNYNPLAPAPGTAESGATPPSAVGPPTRRRR